MAGSFKHCVEIGESGRYELTRHLEDMIENLGDAEEAIEEMVFMIKFLANDCTIKIDEAHEAYYASLRPPPKTNSITSD